MIERVRVSRERKILMDENANPNPEALTSIDAAPTYYPMAYVVPYANPAYYPPAYVLTYALYAIAPMVATHYSLVRYIYAAVMPPYLPTMSFLGANPSTASMTEIEAEAKLPTPAKVEIPRQYRVCVSYIFNF